MIIKYKRIHIIKTAQFDDCLHISNAALLRASSLEERRQALLAFNGRRVGSLPLGPLEKWEAGHFRERTAGGILGCAILTRASTYALIHS
jgi:hypothetical protein